MDVANDAAVSKGGMISFSKREDGEQSDDPLFGPVSRLSGVGPRIADMLSRLLGARPGQTARRLDLLLHMPHGLVDHDLKEDAADLVEGERVTADVTVIAHHPPYQRRQPYRVDCVLGDEALQLVFFQGRRNYLQDQLPIGAQKVISGKLGRYGKGRNQCWQIVHPDLITTSAAISGERWLQPVYPSTQGLTQRVLQSRIRTALDDLMASASDLPEWQDSAWLKLRSWPSLPEALRQVHVPDKGDDIELTSKARARLAYDELLATQLALSLSRDRGQERDGVAKPGDGRLRRAFLDALSFHLTAAQQQAAIEIGQDLSAPDKMLRLLQGDVGSGKTVVAALAMLQAIE
ncbi:MAG: hypothetical protein AAF543_13080, partial [Pseudomonadota bacterium]